MKRIISVIISFTLIALSLNIGLVAQNTSGPTQTMATGQQPGSDKEKLSYTLGYFFGSDLKKEQIEMDTTIFILGFKDALSGRPSLIPDSTMRKLYTDFSEEMNVKKMMTAKITGERNKKEADSCLAENKKKDSVVALPSGLQYKILREGTGIQPTLNDTVVTHYRGWFLNGKEFDNSYTRGEPAMFTVRGIIRGWAEALQLMKVGSKWQVWIPPSLAYGERGYGSVIEPNSLLQFEVELLDVKKGPPPAVKTENKETPKKEAVKKDAKKSTKTK